MGKPNDPGITFAQALHIVQDLAVMHEKPTFAWQLTMLFAKLPRLEVVNVHGTAKGTRMVVKTGLDQHHEYEVLINPLYKEVPSAG